MGSGAIFPVFPPRILEGLPRSGDRVELIDGGFAHNSPIEAAVLWGATHIVLIEASPIEHLDPHNFAENAIGAFLHLYYQAQLIDARKKEQVVIFTLRPEAPHPCVLDFSRNLIHSTVEKGYRDARGEVQRGRTTLLGQPTFRKEVGEPLFQEMTRK
jgi:predicted acylesterase/phospholipase RssA